jgi:hypothetical protein
MTLPTRAALTRLTDTELSELQRSLAKYLGTPQEAEAKKINRWIQQERERRDGYGF